MADQARRYTPGLAVRVSRAFRYEPADGRRRRKGLRVPAGTRGVVVSADPLRVGWAEVDLGAAHGGVHHLPDTLFEAAPAQAVAPS